MSELGGTFGPGSSFRFSGYRNGNLDGRNTNFRYPSAWWDVAHMDMPSSVKSLFRWCQYHAVANPLVSAVVRKMAEYPITRIILDDENTEGFDHQTKRWEDLFHNVLDLHRFQVDVGLDRETYGNCLVSIVYPFHKYLQCKACGFKRRAKRMKFRVEWNFANWEYTLSCPRCSHNGPCKVRDEWYYSYKDIKLLRWNPSDIDIDFNPITQTRRYYYNIPSGMRKKLLGKDKNYLEEMPDVFVRAMRTSRPVQLTDRNLYHFRAPTVSVRDNDAGWAYPPILPALKDSFYLQVLKKANEAIMLEHLIPLDILYPSSQDPNASPYQMVNLSDWKRRVEVEIKKWRWDPNHKPIMPLPVGVQRIGGDGRALMPTQEIRVWSEHIIAGMGAPQEFVFGGMSWTGSSVTLRMLENRFLNYREEHHRFLNHFVIPNISRFMGWREVKVHMKAFKMADDLQAKQMLLSLNQLKKVSDSTLLAEFDKDPLDEARLIEKELRRNLEIARLDSLYKAEIQGEAQQVATKYQLKAQKTMMEEQAEMQREQAKQGGIPGQPQQGGGPPQQGGIPGQPQPPGAGGEENGGAPESVNIIDYAEALARRLQSVPEEQRGMYLNRMEQQSPRLHQLVMQKMSTMAALEQQPLPERGPPRRAGGAGI